jgi:hypothetical protein
MELYTAGTDGMILCWRPRLGNSPTGCTSRYVPASAGDGAVVREDRIPTDAYAGGGGSSAGAVAAAVGAGVFGTTGGTVAAGAGGAAGEDDDDWSSDDDSSHRPQWVPPILRQSRPL